jgi:hypothetical protein
MERNDIKPQLLPKARVIPGANFNQIFQPFETLAET